MDLFIQDLKKYSTPQLRSLARYLGIDTNSESLIEDISAEQYKLHVRRATMGMLSIPIDPFEQALLDAAENGDPQTVAELLDRGIPIDAQDKAGDTALILAALNSDGTSNIDTVKLLLDRGAKIDLQNNIGITALIFASWLSNHTSNIETVKLLLDRGAKIDLKDKDGNTALTLASRYSNTSNIATVKLLLDRGAKIDLKNNDGETALILAAEYSADTSNIETVKLLLDRGAKIDLQDNDGDTALTGALLNVAEDLSNIETVQLLLDRGAQVDLPNGKGQTALIIASSYSDDIFKLFLDRSTKIDLQDNDGVTALMYAAENNIDNVKLLLDRGAKIDLQDNEGMTALMYAFGAFEEVPIVKLLLDRGAKVDITNNKGQTALDFAKALANPELIRLLKPIPTDWYKSCTEQTDIISQETWQELTAQGELADPVIIQFPDRVECGERANYLQTIKISTKFTVWVPNPSVAGRRWANGEPLIDDSGHGGMPAPGGPQFIKLTPYHYVLLEKDLLGDSMEYTAELVNPEPVRYGNIKGTFGISEQHGQIPGVLVYRLKAKQVS